MNKFRKEFERETGINTSQFLDWLKIHRTDDNSTLPYIEWLEQQLETQQPLKEVYNSLTFETNDGEELSICMRDSGYEFKYQGKWYEAKNGVVNKRGENQQPTESEEVDVDYAINTAFVQIMHSKLDEYQVKETLKQFAKVISHPQPKQVSEEMIMEAFEAGQSYQDGFDYYTGKHDGEYPTFNNWWQENKDRYLSQPQSKQPTESEVSEEILKRFWRDANACQSIDVPLFDINEYAEQWISENLPHPQPKQVSEDVIRELIKGLNAEVNECNEYLEKRNDMGGTHRADDPFETISFTRGKSMGFIIARDRLIKSLPNTKQDGEKYYCQAPDCNNEIPEPKMCCSGSDCGCMGLPIDPPVCSEECYNKCINTPNENKG